MPQVKIGVIGGTGLYDVEGLTDIEEINIDTPFGKPSDSIITGRLEGVAVAFLPRHGRGHSIMPTEVPSRANIYALKSLGVEHIIAVNSVGSLKEGIKQGDLVISDQLIDRTKSRINTFFGEGIVAHIQFAEPFCRQLRKVLYKTAGDAGANAHSKGTYVVMEGPAFSTKAESHLHSSWGGDIIGMTALPEAKLAREAEICYAIIACATDYDVWHETEKEVGVEVILETMHRQEELCKHIIKLSIPEIAGAEGCKCSYALRGAIVTAPEAMPEETKKKLNLLIDKYIR
ncbi:MAG: S-methyl-5'-thioadenosine phosphorylase [Dehalococcoidia bacterium]|nr:MAG: S-methyl-5'-thioadenosine phosphorylase [Dehalococcoidia bacterium]